MSPRPAAPRIASVTAWQATSASEWPSAPRVERDRHAADDQRPPVDQPVQVVAGADAPSRRRAPPRRMPLPRRLEIVRRRDLHVARVAVDDVDLVAGALGQRRFVGRLDAGSRAAAIAARQHVAAEALRRLREVDRLARDGLGDPRRRRSTRFTVSRDCSAAIAAPCADRRVDRAVDQIGASRTAAPRRG